jgi:uncharacterized membrane protein YfcA
MSEELVFLSFIITGLLSGLLGGLLGIGGGVITVPFLYYIFLYSHLVSGPIMQIAVATSLAASCFTAALSTVFQLRKKAVQFSLLKWIVLSLILGCILGSILAHFISSSHLQILFGGMALLLGIYFSFPQIPEFHFSFSPKRGLPFFSFIIGLLSSLLGIGGGSLFFPILLGYRVSPSQASGTSAASTLITTLIGSLTYLLIGWKRPDLSVPFGSIDLSAFIALSLGSIITAPIGVELSHRLPVFFIKRVFGVCLGGIGLSMFFL